MSEETQKSCRQFLLAIGTVLGGALIGYGVLWLLFRLLLPFTLAWGLAFCLQPILKKLHARTGWSKQKLGIGVVLLFWGVFFWMIALFCRQLWRELSELLAYLRGNADQLLETCFAKWDAFRTSLPFADPNSGGQDQRLWARERLRSALASFSSQTPALLQKIAQFLPASALSFVIFLLATFYFTADFSELHHGFFQHLPPLWQKKLTALRLRGSHALRCYLRAYLILLFLTFSELLLGLSLLRVPYALGLAFLIAVLDFLPVIGVGTVLLPWALITALSGNYSLALGLLFLFAIMTVLRQILQPHIIGAQMGLSPLATLFATYAGYRLFGFFGILAAPLCLLFWKKDPSAPADRTKGDALKQASP